MDEPKVGVFRIELAGDGIQPGKVPLRDVKELVEQVQAGVERVARVMSGEPGTAPGPLPRPIKDATDLLLVGVESGSAVLAVEVVPPKEEPMEDRLFVSSPDIGLRAVDRFVGGLHEIERQDEVGVPEFWDNSVVEIAERLSQLARERSFNLTFVSQMPQLKRTSATITPQNAERFTVRHSPILRPASARGILIMVDLETARVDLKQERGRRIQCVFSEGLMTRVEQLLGEKVKVQGEEEFDVAINRRGKLRIESLEVDTEQGRLDEDFWRNPSAAELASEQEVRPIGSVADLAIGDISKEEISEFIVVIRNARSEA